MDAILWHVDYDVVGLLDVNAWNVCGLCVSEFYLYMQLGQVSYVYDVIGVRCVFLP